MNFAGSIMGFLKNPNNRSFLIGAALVIFIMLYFRSCQNNRALRAEMDRQEKIHDQNVRALNDTIRIVTNRAGELEATKSSFIATVEELKKLNADLYAEVQKEIGDVKSLIKAGVTVDNPITVSNELADYGNGSYGLKFEKLVDTDTMFSHIKGVSRFSINNNVIMPGTTEITTNKTKFNIVLGFKEVDENYEVFARSNNPNVEVFSLDGSLILPKNKKSDDVLTPPTKTKRFGLGPTIGMGFGTVGGRWGATPYVGFGLHYSILNF